MALVLEPDGQCWRVHATDAPVWRRASGRHQDRGIDLLSRTLPPGCSGAASSTGWGRHGRAVSLVGKGPDHQITSEAQTCFPAIAASPSRTPRPCRPDHPDSPHPNCRHCPAACLRSDSSCLERRNETDPRLRQTHYRLATLAFPDAARRGAGPAERRGLEIAERLTRSIPVNTNVQCFYCEQQYCKQPEPRANWPAASPRRHRRLIRRREPPWREGAAGKIRADARNPFSRLSVPFIEGDAGGCSHRREGRGRRRSVY